ncbi:hypothetical protein CCAX7_16310 [Capsulimonas corticalis]|uniref:Uncharacterized protein n=2 Tax=Capsulimonas corticalis TaxID=2219043 RepID=A0A402CYX3_9BACT|nr:hypothetical protein CCAX7_16310 [Capsulimonas corticalis]
MAARKCLGALCAALLILSAGAHAFSAPVTLMRTPNGGIQPQAAVDNHGVLHVIYYLGDPAHGNLFYVRKKLGADAPFSHPVRVNSVADSAIALGTIRGAQMAIGKDDSIHVVWNGSEKAPKGSGGTPMLYARLASASSAFTPERSLITWAGGLDGGGSVAADPRGNVYVVWHASAPGKDEASGGVYLARSGDDGRTFARETKINTRPTGQCGCCSMRAFVDSAGTLYILYRSAGGNFDRDTTLLASRDGGASFASSMLSPWRLGACPMSSFSLAEGPGGVIGAWETADQVYRAPLSRSAVMIQAATAPAGSGKRKYPTLVSNKKGKSMLAWVEGAGWERGGALAWQVYGPAGQPEGPAGRANGVPVWSFVTAVARDDGSFLLIY